MDGNKEAPSWPAFARLPPEIRREIYILATPPRFVHVQERTLLDWEDFHEHFRSNMNIKLHPSLAYFAHNWREVIPNPSEGRLPDGLAIWGNHMRQTTLEEHGFASGKCKPQPWSPTPETPEIPIPWLESQPRVAWCIVRESYLFSLAPIPPLLHAFSESRQTLIRYGYRLAFGTRTHGPRTWFHFRNDVLHLDRDTDCQFLDEPFLLCGSRWDIGQFLPDDLSRVQRISLKGFHIHREDELVSEISNLLRLLGNTDELFIVEWMLDRQIEHARSCAKNRWKPTGKEVAMTATADVRSAEMQRWGWIDCDDVDAMQFELTCHDQCWCHFVFHHWPTLSVADERENSNGSFWRYRSRPEAGPNAYFQSTSQRLFNRLSDYRHKVLQDQDSVAPWKIPDVKIVHLGTASAVQEFSIYRDKWRHFISRDDTRERIRERRI